MCCSHHSGLQTGHLRLRQVPRRLPGHTPKISLKDTELIIPIVHQRFCKTRSLQLGVDQSGWWTPGIKSPCRMFPQRRMPGCPLQTVKSRGKADVGPLNTLQLTALLSSNSSAASCCPGNKCRVPSTQTSICQPDASLSGNNTSGRTETTLQSSNNCLWSCQNNSRPAKLSRHRVL